MRSVPDGQVTLSNLLFTMSWEDPESDRQALRIAENDTVLAITSGGCNTLGFLLQNPRKLYAVDINPAQSHLLELKMAAMRRLDHSEFLSFLGLSESGARGHLFDAIKDELSPPARRYWGSNRNMVISGILGKGRFERFVSVARRVLRIVQGQQRIHGLFACSSPESQKIFFDAVWDSRRFRWIFKIFFNKHVLARLGLSADYFTFDDGTASFADSFYKRVRHALRDLPLAGNYFIAQYLLGRYRVASEMPDYMIEENYDVIRNRLERIVVVTEDVKEWLACQDVASIDCFSLSNICELMNQEDTERTFLEVARTARPGARICFRNLMISRTVPPSLTPRINRDEHLSASILSRDRSFVYSRVDALTVMS